MRRIESLPYFNFLVGTWSVLLTAGLIFTMTFRNFFVRHPSVLVLSVIGFSAVIYVANEKFKTMLKDQ